MELERQFPLITMNGVKELCESGQQFSCRYLLTGVSRDGKPRYHVLYKFDGKEHLLVKTNYDIRGPKARVFNLWPGLYLHHREFGDGSSLLLNPDDSINTVREGGRNDLLEGRSD